MIKRKTLAILTSLVVASMSSANAEEHNPFEGMTDLGPVPSGTNISFDDANSLYKETSIPVTVDHLGVFSFSIPMTCGDINLKGLPHKDSDLKVSVLSSLNKKSECNDDEKKLFEHVKSIDEIAVFRKFGSSSIDLYNSKNGQYISFYDVSKYAQQKRSKATDELETKNLEDNIRKRLKGTSWAFKGNEYANEPDKDLIYRYRDFAGKLPFTIRFSNIDGIGLFNSEEKTLYSSFEKNSDSTTGTIELENLTTLERSALNLSFHELLFTKVLSKETNYEITEDYRLKYGTSEMIPYYQEGTSLAFADLETNSEWESVGGFDGSFTITKILINEEKDQVKFSINGNKKSNQLTLTSTTIENEINPSSPDDLLNPYSYEFVFNDEINNIIDFDNQGYQNFYPLISSDKVSIRTFSNEEIYIIFETTGINNPIMFKKKK